MKRKITLVVAIMLVLVMTLSSCGMSGNKIEKILNADFDISAKVFGEAKNIAELDGYAVDGNYSSEYFLVFTKADPETAVVTTKVLSRETGAVVATFASSETAVVTLEMVGYSIPAFLVTNTPVGEDAGDPTYSLYDATGVVVTTAYKPANPYKLGKDMIVYDYAGYTVTDEGKLEKKMDIPEYLGIERIHAETDKYYYVFDELDVTVYTHEFELVSHWAAPSYALTDEGFAVRNVLQNGDIFVQYTYALDEDATDFDYYDEDGKYNVDAFVINAKNGKAKAVKLDYVVEIVLSNDYLNEEFDEDANYFTDKFENIAIVFPLVDGRVDSSATAMDLVIMGNNGKIKSVLNYVDDMVSIGQKIGDDLYLVQTASAVVVINGNGKVVKTLNNASDLEFVDGYIVGEVGIYDMSFELIYDFRANKVTEAPEVIGDTIFVKAENDKGYTIIAFNGGEQKTILTYDEESTTPNNYFGTLSDVAYYIIDGTTGEYTYYNADGAVIIKTPTPLEIISTNDKAIIFVTEDAEGVAKYYVSTVVAE